MATWAHARIQGLENLHRASLQYCHKAYTRKEAEKGPILLCASSFALVAVMKKAAPGPFAYFLQT